MYMYTHVSYIYTYADSKNCVGLILAKEVWRGSVKRVGKDHRDKQHVQASRFFPFFFFSSFFCVTLFLRDDGCERKTAARFIARSLGFLLKRIHGWLSKAPATKLPGRPGVIRAYPSLDANLASPPSFRREVSSPCFFPSRWSGLSLWLNFKQQFIHFQNSSRISIKILKVSFFESADFVS